MRYLSALVQPQPLAEGTEIHATYRLTRLLGQGGMGVVWEADHMRLPKQVAIKFLLGAGDGSAEMLARFRREAEIASRLSHPHIVAVHDFNTLPDGTPYLVMERLVGTDLRAALQGGPLPLEQARAITLQVASALSLAHRGGVVHRDLKPENIFLCEAPKDAPRVKVLDFGISKIQDGVSPLTREDRILGTPGYMAPEQAMGRNSIIDGRTDVFSLAAILYEMVTGENVFVGNTLAEVVYKVVHVSPAPLGEASPGVPAPMSRAVERALSKDLAQRHESIEAFASALAADAPDPAGSADPGGRGTGGSDLAPTGSEATVMADTSDVAAPLPEGVGQHPRRLRVWVAGGVIVGLAVLLLATTLLLEPEPREERPASATSAPAPAAGALPEPRAQATGQPSAAAARAQAIRGEAEVGTRAASLSVEDAAAADVPPPAKVPPKPRRKASPVAERVPASVQEALEKARAALAREDFGATLRLARSSLYEAKTSEAYAVMAQAYCGKGDVGMAKAMLRNVPRGAARAVQAYCQQRGITLQR